MTHNQFAEVYAVQEQYRAYQSAYQKLKSAYEKIESGEENQTTSVELTFRGFKLMYEIPVSANKKVTLAVIQSLMAHYTEEVRVIEHFYSEWFKLIEKAAPIATEIQLLKTQLDELRKMYNEPLLITRFHISINGSGLFTDQSHSDDTDKKLAIIDIMIFAKSTKIEKLEQQLLEI